jgi:amino acid adenylation domain-containing protein
MHHASFNDSKHSILFGLNQTDLIRDEILADIFEATAERLPNQTALIFGESKLSYRELNVLADLVASNLISHGVIPGQIIGLWLPRSIELLVMQLAIAKTGAAWLPFDADTPAERIAICLNDAKAYGLISCDALIQHLSGHNAKLLDVETILSPSIGELKRRTGTLPEHPAYVIYTSGSTGKPKGILVNQGSICHFLRSENSQLGVTSADLVYQGFSVAFDMSFEEIWISYLVGATLWIAPKELATDAESLPDALFEKKVTVLHAVPTLLALFNRSLPSLRIINLGGEACPESLVNKWATKERKMFNTYGPTETTVSASLAQLYANEAVTIGLPLPNYNLLVVDPDPSVSLRLLDRGDTGELCISGLGVAIGYLGRPDLTAEKFLDNPFATGIHDQRLYRTGDLARIDNAGRVQWTGAFGRLYCERKWSRH